MYIVRVSSNGTYIGEGCTICTTSPCFYAQKITTLPTTNITIFVAHVEGVNAADPQNNTIFKSEFLFNRFIINSLLETMGELLFHRFIINSQLETMSCKLSVNVQMVATSINVLNIDFSDEH